jgi:CxxC motif-containing protein (DUF1111 family)
MHDGSAATIADALLAHAGEARPTMERLSTLPPTVIAELMAFLQSL